MDIKKFGEQSRFRRVGSGIYAVNRGLHLPIPQPLSFGDAAEKVLDQFGNEKPMHYRDITKKALELGLISTEGKTPEATMCSQLNTEIKRKTQRGETPRFEKVGRATFGLTKWVGRGISREIEHHNRKVRKMLLERIQNMNPVDFEELIGELLTALGFESVLVTPLTGDGGIDVRGTLVIGEVVKVPMAVQAKCWKHNVSAPVIQQLRGSLGVHERGLVITTSDFSKGAKEEAQLSDRTPIALMNGKQLVSLLVENDIGVIRTHQHIIELAEKEEDKQ